MKVSTIDMFSNDSRVASFDVNILDVRNPYIIKAIAGLDAEQIVPRFYAQGVVSQDKFYDLSLESREIVMRIGLNPNYRVNVQPSDLRGDLYRAIASSRNGNIQLRFNDDNSVVGAITGFVTKFEAPVFSKETEVQISMRCDDPVFKSLYLAEIVTATLSTTNPLISDPISTSPHGFKFELTFTGNVNPFVIQDSATPDWKFQIDYAFLTGDELFFSSEFGDKYLYRIRSGVTVHLMDKILSGSIWPLIFPGDNQFNILGTTFTWGSIYYYETHWGV